MKLAMSFYRTAVAALVVEVATSAGCRAAITVDAVKHCFELDFGKKAASMTLDPGRFTVRVSGHGVRWGTSARLRGLRTRHVLVDLDPADCSVLVGDGQYPVASLCYNDASASLDGVSYPQFQVHRQTKIHLYLVDSVVEGNAGSVRVEVQRVSEGSPRVRTVGTRVLNPTANCYHLDFRRAKRVTLAVGRWSLACTGGDIRYGRLERYDTRRCANVLIDCNPADVLMRADHGASPDYDWSHVAALGLPAPGESAMIQVLRRTTLNFYLTDFQVSGNAGSVTVSISSADGC